MYQIIFAVLIALFSIGCSSKYPDVPTTKYVDINKYMGSWYEIARFEHFFEKGCKNVTATYSLNEDQTIKVLNQCTMIQDNKPKVATGVAYSTNESNTKLKVSFFRPFYGDYWVFELDQSYQYALVGSPSGEYLWILSRDKNISEDIKSHLLQKVISLGFDPNKFIWTIQE